MPATPLANSGNNRHFVVGLTDLVLGASLLFGIWRALPARWWPIDVPATALGVGLLISGVLLLRGASERPSKFTLAMHWLTLLFGLTVISLLAFSVSLLVGLYGPVGAGGALIFVLVAALLLPYLVFLPTWQIVALRSVRAT